MRIAPHAPPLRGSLPPHGGLTRLGAARRRVAAQGFAVVSAIFLVLILAALGGFMLTLSSTQQRSAAQDVLGMRAYWAARAGVEWGMTGAVASNVCAAASTTLAVDGFSVVVHCRAMPYTEAGTSLNILQLTAVASSGTVGNVGFIERSLSASVER